MTSYKTQPGDLLDAIAYRHYGATDADRALAAIYQANPRLAEMSIAPPPDTVIILPDLQTPNQIKLWD